MGESVVQSMDIQKVMAKIRNHAELYAVMSGCTHMPFVHCDPESFDDEIFLYFDKETAKNSTKWLVEQKNPIQIAQIDVKNRLAFFTSLFSMGVNAICVDHSLETECVFQLEQLIKRQSPDQMQKEQVRVENPSLHLTALYFSQELKKNAEQRDVQSEELRNLNEELIAHFQKGTYIVAVEDGNKLPILQKGGVSYQPLFTDIWEFQKFNREKKFGAMLVPCADIKKKLAKETQAVVLNPFGADIILNFA